MDPQNNKPNTGNMINSNVFLNESTLLQEVLAERDEIWRHKWIESEKRGHDIGFDRALLEWVKNHRNDWRAYWRKQAKLRKAH